MQSVFIGNPNISLSKTPSAYTGRLDDYIVYTINYSNTGYSEITDAVLTEGPLPDWIDGSSNVPPWTLTSGIYTLELPGGVLEAQESGSATFGFTIVGPIPEGTTSLPNIVTLSYTDPVIGPTSISAENSIMLATSIIGPTGPTGEIGFTGPCCTGEVGPTGARGKRCQNQNQNQCCESTVILLPEQMIPCSRRSKRRTRIKYAENKN